MDVDYEYDSYSEKERYELQWRILYSEVYFLETGLRPKPMTLAAAFRLAHPDWNKV